MADAATDAAAARREVLPSLFNLGRKARVRLGRAGGMARAIAHAAKFQTLARPCKSHVPCTMRLASLASGVFIRLGAERSCNRARNEWQS
jgi:hypothetical protein